LLAGWNSAKGRLLCICWVIEWQGSIWLLLPAELRDAVARRLGMFVLRADVRVECPELSISFGLGGTQNTGKVSDKDNITHCFYNSNCFSLQPHYGGALQLGGASGELTETDWRLANIRAGQPTVWAETQEEFIPQMLNLDRLDAISFTKGCYVGQEIVARTQNLGRIKRRMYGYQLAGDAAPAPGTAVLAADKTVGQVVDAINRDGLTELLAVVRIESCAAELKLADFPQGLLQPVELPYALED
jgi:folate-binding protein YgfZ